MFARFNGVYILGEAKFLSDFGGHQNAQFEDAMATIKAKVSNAVIIAILDGVLYGKSDNKMHLGLRGEHSNSMILSSLLLRDFCYSITTN